MTHGVVHQFPFSFDLPESMASSFEGPHGHVRYTLRALLFPINKDDRQSSKKDKKKKKKKSVVEPSPIESVIPLRITDNIVNLSSIPEALVREKHF